MAAAAESASAATVIQQKTEKCCVRSNQISSQFKVEREIPLGRLKDVCNRFDIDSVKTCM